MQLTEGAPGGIWSEVFAVATKCAVGLVVPFCRVPTTAVQSCPRGVGGCVHAPEHGSGVDTATTIRVSSASFTYDVIHTSSPVPPLHMVLGSNT